MNEINHVIIALVASTLQFHCCFEFEFPPIMMCVILSYFIFKKHFHELEFYTRTLMMGACTLYMYMHSMVVFVNMVSFTTSQNWKLLIFCRIIIRLLHGFLNTSVFKVIGPGAKNLALTTIFPEGGSIIDGTAKVAPS